MNNTVNANSAVYDSIKELSRTIGLSLSNTYKGLRSGDIPSIRMGRRFIVPRAAISRWLESAGSAK